MSLKFICIDNSGQNYIKKSKIYEAINEVDDHKSVGIKILNDNDDIVFYRHSRFVSLIEVRDKKINEILNEK
jgi:hypothetical protein